VQFIYANEHKRILRYLICGSKGVEKAHDMHLKGPLVRSSLSLA